jgi:hypothetical protein
MGAEGAMGSRADWLKRTIQERCERMRRTADDLATMIHGRSDTELGRRPEARGWAAKEVVCHLRDIEELVILRFHMMLAMEDPKVLVAGAPPSDLAAWGFSDDVPFPLDPDRWAEERQYLRNDTVAALAAFRRRRSEVLALLAALPAEQWARGSIHPSHGRVTFADWTAGIAAHDDNHLAQLCRALDGEG